MCAPYIFNIPSTNPVAHQSILEVFVLCIAGYVLARKGILDRKTQKVCVGAWLDSGAKPTLTLLA
jgi:hypothetical protein